MKNIFVTIVLVTIALTTFRYSFGQSSSSVTFSGLTDPERQRREQERRAERDLDRRMNIMRDLEKSSRLRSQPQQTVVISEPVLDKDAKERVRLLRRIDPRDLEENSGVLKLQNTGILKLFPNQNCVTAQLVRIDGECSDFVPMSSSFSFRQRAYIDAAYQDLEFVDGMFVSRGFFNQAAFAELGDTPIEEIDSNHSSILALTTIGTSDHYLDDARDTAKQLTFGLSANGITLSNKTMPEVGKTYALRVVAYKLDHFIPAFSPKSSLTELKFLSLSVDRRVDQTIVFRVVRKDEKNGLTIVWREIKSADAPRLKLGKGKSLSDFR